MSLKWFHVVFITLSVILSLWFGIWGLFNQQICSASSRWPGRPVWCVYGNHFLAKVRKFGV